MKTIHRIPEPKNKKYVRKKKLHQDNKRIQKLLSSEYHDFKEPILVESPFAETTRNGRGIRQVSLALTKTKLIIAADVFEKNYTNYVCPKMVDPSVESFELLSVLPLKYIKLSIFHRRKRYTIKARFIINGKVKYYELNGIKNNLLWNKWSKEIKNIVIQKVSYSSLSETSAGSSSSVFSTKNSEEIKDTVYRIRRSNKKCRSKSNWPSKNVFLGQSFEKFHNDNYKSLPVHFSKASVTDIRSYLETRSIIKYDNSWLKYESDKLNVDTRKCSKTDLNLAGKINRFGSGVLENCQTKLYLKPVEDKENVLNSSDNFYTIMDKGVSIWETRSNKIRRNYGLALSPHFLFAFGPWSVEPGERESVQLHRSSSFINLHKSDPDISLPLSRRQLTASISCDNLKFRINERADEIDPGRIILFWTPDYWYRPKAAITAYQEVRQHLHFLQNYLTEKEKLNSSKSLFRRKKSCSEKERSNLMKRLFLTKKTVNENSDTCQLRKLLQINIKICAWDLDSSTLSKQLTLIERDLFVRIPPGEVEIMVQERSSRNAPNFGAWIAFSHRISCLVANEIVTVQRMDVRARIISRFIITANKCFSMGNFQSCRSILAGLQSPAVYRLKITWACIRKYYSTKYETMEKLCTIFESPFLRMYKNAWKKCELNPPSIPYVGDFLIKLLNQKSDNGLKIKSTKNNLRTTNLNKFKTSKSEEKAGIFKQIISAAFMLKQNNSRVCWTSRQTFFLQRVIIKWHTYTVKSKSIKNDSRKLIISSISAWLQKCQKHAQEYNFPGHSLAWEYLLKVRYKEEKDNFFISLRTES